MKVSGISGVRSRSAFVPSDPVTLRLNSVRQGLRKHGAVVLNNNEMDWQVIERLQRQFGRENVRVEKSSNLKVSVDNFKR